MSFIWVGQDEIRFPEQFRAVAEEVVAALPRVQRRGEELLGLTSPSVRVVISEGPPRARDYVRLSSRAVGVLFLYEVGALALVAAGQWPVAFGLFGWLAANHFGPTLFRSVRGMRRAWGHVGGLTTQCRLLAPVIALRVGEWAPPTEALLAESEDHAAIVTSILAHEYAHVLLYGHYQIERLLPAWLDEGLAAWFSEQVLGKQVWLPESRQCLREAEPERDPRYDDASPLSMRLWARYYWEARAVVEQGLLPEILRARADQLDAFRPKLEVSPETEPER